VDSIVSALACREGKIHHPVEGGSSKLEDFPVGRNRIEDRVTNPKRVGVIVPEGIEDPKVH